MIQLHSNLFSRPKIAGIVLVIFHIVGLVGLSLPSARALFVSLTPFNQLLSAFLLFLFHKPLFSRDVVVFLFVAIWGFLIEMMGVNTGLLFGDYTYLSALGVKLGNTPLLIGLNWLLLSYGIFTLTKSLRVHAVFRIILASAGMVALDLLIEPVAPFMDMWIWADGAPPLKNYFAWFFVSAVCMLIYEKFLIKYDNKLAVWLVAVQFGFFTVLNFIA